MIVFIGIENKFDKIKFLFLIKDKTFSKMGINGYILKMEKYVVFSPAGKQQFT